MNALLDSICKAGLNRARIHDALADIEQYDGVTGHMIFDPNQKNVAPMYLGTVHDGAISYRVATMDKQPVARHSTEAEVPASTAPAPYARVGEDGVNYLGPRSADLPPGPVRVVVFGPNAKEVAASAEMLAALREGGRERPAMDGVAGRKRPELGCCRDAVDSCADGRACNGDCGAGSGFEPLIGTDGAEVLCSGCGSEQ